MNHDEDPDLATNHREPAKRPRRDVLKTGATLVPVILTLHAAPAWAGTDYTRVAYRYGIHAGLCRNPNFDANSNAPWKRDKFMPCDQIRQTSIDAGPSESSDQSSAGTQDIISF